MKRFITGLLVGLLAGSMLFAGLNYAAWDTSAYAPTNTVADNTTAAQANFNALEAGTALVPAIRDDDGDTKVQVEESSDEDKIRFDIAGTETVVFGDGTNEAIGTFTNAGTSSNVAFDQNGNGVVIDIDNDATDTNCFQIANHSTGHGLYFDQEVGLASGKSLMYLYSNAAQKNTSLVQMVMNNATSDQAVLAITNQGVGPGITIDQNGNGVGLNIDGENTTTDLMNLDGDTLTTGSLARFSSTSTDSSTRSLVEIINDSSAATGATCLDIKQDAGKRAAFIDQNGAAPAIEIDMADANTAVIKFTGNVGNDSTKTVGSDAPADWIEIDIGGTSYFIPVYAAS